MCRTAGIAAGLRPGGQTLRLVRMKIDKTSAGIYSGQCHGGACLLRKVCRIASIAGRLLEEQASGVLVETIWRRRQAAGVNLAQEGHA